MSMSEKEKKTKITIDREHYIWYNHYMSTKKRKYAVGDLIYITDQVHDARMPTNRIGLVSGDAPDRDTYWVMFNNGQILKFHASTMTPLTKFQVKTKLSRDTGVNNG